MANEIAIVATLQYTNNVAGAVVAALNRTLTTSLNIAGTKYVAGVQVLTTSPLALGIGGIGTVGWIWAKNQDPTNNALFRSATGTADTITIKPGEACLFRSTTSTPFVSSSAATVALEYLVLEN